MVRISGEGRIIHFLLPGTTDRTENRILREDESNNLFSETFPSFCSRRQHYFSDLLNTLDAVVIGVTLLIAITVMFYEKKFLRDVPMYETYYLPLKTTLVFLSCLLPLICCISHGFIYYFD